MRDPEKKTPDANWGFESHHRNASKKLVAPTGLRLQDSRHGSVLALHDREYLPGIVASTLRLLALFAPDSGERLS
jgi:hypothetical protein